VRKNGEKREKWGKIGTQPGFASSIENEDRQAAAPKQGCVLFPEVLTQPAKILQPSTSRFLLVSFYRRVNA